MSYQPPNAPILIGRIKLAIAAAVVASKGHQLSDCPTDQLCSVVLATEYMMAGAEDVNIKPIDPAFFPANLYNPEKYQESGDIGYCRVIAALGDKEGKQPFYIGTLAPGIFCYPYILDELEPLKTEDPLSAIQWITEVFNVGIERAVIGTPDRFLTHFVPCALYEVDPLLGKQSAYSKRVNRTSKLAAICHSSDIAYTARTNPTTLDHWLSRDLESKPANADWLRRGRVSQMSMMEVNQAMKEGRIELLTVGLNVKHTYGGTNHGIEWDALLATANEWKDKMVKEAKKPGVKKKKKADEIPPWAYRADGSLQLRYTYIVRADEIPEEHREKAVAQFTQELMEEYEERLKKELASL